MTARIVVLEESFESATLLAGLLTHAGFEARASTTAAEARSVMNESAPERVLLLVSSTWAASLGPSFNELLGHDPHPRVVFTCTQPATCPLFPGLLCVGLGCLRKPWDFVYPDIVSHLNRLLAQP
jgi:hypothetical protein